MAFIILLLLPLTLFSLEDIPIKQQASDEQILFERINELRKDFNLQPLRYSDSLYKDATAENKRLLAATGKKELSERKATRQIFYKRFTIEHNHLLTIFNSLKASFFFAKVIKSNEYNSFALSIIKKQSVYHTYHIFAKDDNKKEKDVKGEAASYSKEENDFDNVLKFLGEKSLKFGFSRKQVDKELTPLVKSLTRSYRKLSYHEEISLFQKEPYLLESYLRLRFSSSPRSFYGLRSIAFFFKEASFLKIKEWTKTVYGIKEPKDSLQSPYSFYRLRPEDKFYLVIKDNMLIHIQGKKSGGTYFAVASLKFVLKFINNHKKGFGLKKDLSRFVWHRLFVEYLKKQDKFSSLFGFIKDVNIAFYKNRKEIRATFYLDADKLEYRYFYSDDFEANRIREVFLLNGIKKRELSISTKAR